MYNFLINKIICRCLQVRICLASSERTGFYTLLLAKCKTKVQRPAHLIQIIVMKIETRKSYISIQCSLTIEHDNNYAMAEDGKIFNSG